MNSDIVVGQWKQWRGNFWAMWSEWFDSDSYLSGVVQEDYGLQEGDGLREDSDVLNGPDAPATSDPHAGTTKLH